MNGATALPLARTKTPPKTPMVINTGMSQYFRRARRKPQNSVTKSSIDTFPSESQACAALQQRTLAIKVIARDAWQVRGRKSSSRAARTNCGAISFSRVRHNHAISPGGSYVDRVLRGANPANLPVEIPTKHETVLNLKTARPLVSRSRQPCWCALTR